MLLTLTFCFLSYVHSYYFIKYIMFLSLTLVLLISKIYKSYKHVVICSDLW